MEKKKADALTYQMLPPTVARVNNNIIWYSDARDAWNIINNMFNFQTHLQDISTHILQVGQYQQKHDIHLSQFDHLI